MLFDFHPYVQCFSLCHILLKKKMYKQGLLKSFSHVFLILLNHTFHVSTY